MRTRLRYFSFALMLVSFLAWRSQPAQAAYFNCYGAPAWGFQYFGSEVQCDSSYRENLCSAGCSYCFNMICDFVGPTCDAGSSATGFCKD